MVLGLALPTEAQTTVGLGDAKITAKITGERLPLIPADTLLYVENRGYDRIFMEISGHEFRLVVDASEVDRSANAFPIPRDGELTIDVTPLLIPDGDNYVRVASQGPGDPDRSRIILAPVFVNGQTQTAYKIPSLDPVPVRFGLDAYPNPIRDAATIRFHVPAPRINGVDVHIAVYDVLGRRLTVLVDGVRYYPGSHTVRWTPRAQTTGVFFVRLLAGSAQETITVARLR